MLPMKIDGSLFFLLFLHASSLFQFYYFFNTEESVTNQLAYYKISKEKKEKKYLIKYTQKSSFH